MAYREISGILDSTNELTPEELNALVPLFEQLQLQYDFIISQPQQDDSQMDAHFKKLYNSTITEFHQQFSPLMQEEPTITYDTSLPTVEELMGDKPDFQQMTAEDIQEYLEMQSILQDTLNEAQENIDALVVRALQVESDLLKLNKPKIIMVILKALGVMYNVAARFGRAAYCTYSHVPQLNASLHHIYDGVDCYLFATSTIVKIQNETYQTVKTVRKSISDLAVVYKKIAEKNSILGKMITLVKNIWNITLSFMRTLRQANRVIDKVVHQLPGATLEVINCGTNFVDSIPYVVQSVANTTVCLMYVDDGPQDYDWMEPEDSTRIPEIIPDPESGESDESFEMP